MKTAIISTSASFFISLSWLDYPIWPIQQIQQYVDSLNGRELLYGEEIPDNATKYAKTLKIAHPFFDIPIFSSNLNMKIRKLFRILLAATGYRKKLVINKNGGNSMRIYKGGSWWGISIGLAKEILTTFERDRKMQRYFKHMYFPDEIVPQTIAFNSDYKDKCTLLDPESADFNSLTPLHYLEYGEVMKVFTESDYETIIQSGKPFARKFMTGISDNLLNYIDRDRLKQN